MRFALVLGLCFFAAAACGQDVLRSAIDEVLRRGDLVCAVGVDGREVWSAASDAVGDALAPPPDDSHKWFVTVVGRDNCPPCERLLADWQSSPALLAWAHPRQSSESWAHWNYYRLDDQTQDWRWKNFEIHTTPTVIIQPPRSGQWGPAETVVMLASGYDGDPAALAAKMRKAVTRYAQRYRQRATQRKDAIDQQVIGDPPHEPAAAIAQAPPFEVPPPFDLPAPSPSLRPFLPSTPLPVIPPAPAEPTGIDLLSVALQGLGLLLGGQGIGNFLLLAILVVQIVRGIRQQKGLPVLLSDEHFQRLTTRLSQLAKSFDPSPDQPIEPASPTPRRRR